MAFTVPRELLEGSAAKRDKEKFGRGNEEPALAVAST